MNIKVKCILCDEFEYLDENSQQAKRLRNKKNKLYLCQTCYHRISEKTKKRHATGNFRLYKEQKKDRYLS